MNYPIDPMDSLMDLTLDELVEVGSSLTLADGSFLPLAESDWYLGLQVLLSEEVRRFALHVGSRY